MSTIPASHRAIDEILAALMADDGSLGGDSRERQQWIDALQAAGEEAVKVLTSCGAISATPGFYRSIDRVADAGFDCARYRREWNALVERIVSPEHRIDITDGPNGLEFYKSLGGYALGLAVGLALAEASR